MPDRDRNRAVLAESMKKLMRRTPFQKLSIQQICDEAGVSRRNFYRYFPDKYALLGFIYERDLGKRLPTDNTLLIHDYVPYLCGAMYEDRKFYANAFAVSGQNSLRAFCRDRMYPKFMHDYGDVFLSDVSARFYVDHFTEAIFDRILLWLKSEPCMPPDEFAEYMIRSTSQVAVRMYENMQQSKRRREAETEA